MTDWDLSVVAGPRSSFLAFLSGAGGGAPHAAEGPEAGFLIRTTGERVKRGCILEATFDPTHDEQTDGEKTGAMDATTGVDDVTGGGAASGVLRFSCVNLASSARTSSNSLWGTKGDVGAFCGKKTGRQSRRSAYGSCDRRPLIRCTRQFSGTGLACKELYIGVGSPRTWVVLV
jgi:hypothetical protein